MSAPMTPERLAAILARAAAATTGPWCTDSWEIYQGTEYVPGMSAWIGETCRGVAGAPELEQDRADASFVAAARTDVPDLVAEVQRLRAQVAAVLALHRKHTDSDHCFADDEQWPCQTRTLLDPTGLAAAVDELGALPMPTGVPSPWERAVTGLNSLVDAQIPFSIELDGHIANPFGDEHIEWDQDASRWRLVHDDEDDAPSPGAVADDDDDGPCDGFTDEDGAPAAGELAEQRHLVDELDHVLEHLADDVRPVRDLRPGADAARRMLADIPAQRDQWGQA